LKIKTHILSLPGFLLVCLLFSFSPKENQPVRFDFYGDTVELEIDDSFKASFDSQLSPESVNAFYEKLNAGNYQGLVKKLLAYKEEYKLDDWLYYQLIRRTAQLISPKGNNYTAYTIYKWFLLCKSGYNATLQTGGGKILFYVQSDETIYDIPYHFKDGKQYVCLNYHDYGSMIDFDKEKFSELPVYMTGAEKSFSYKINQLPSFKPEDYLEKELLFNIYQTEYHFKIKLNPEINTLFANYPVVDYGSYFNIPLSKETYSSLIPLLKQNIKGLNTKNGIDYLMRFTRYAFVFEKDADTFGKEKRFTPEQTLLYEHSDCEDRAALFFYLVKEIYNLPMIVLSYPKHITVAVKLDKPVGTPITYNGEQYTICEPTPQKQDVLIGQIIPSLRNTPYEVVYAYNPLHK
jgi:hypothetical protein